MTVSASGSTGGPGTTSASTTSVTSGGMGGSTVSTASSSGGPGGGMGTGSSGAGGQSGATGQGGAGGGATGQGGAGGSATTTSSSTGAGGATMAYPGPAVGAPMSSWADCSVGLDPTKNGGDLVWLQTMTQAQNCPNPGFLKKLALGPTGDVAVGMECPNGVGISTLASYDRLNGSGIHLESKVYDPGFFGASGQHYAWTGLWFEPSNYVGISLWATLGSGNRLCNAPPGPNWCLFPVAHWISPTGQDVGGPPCADRYQAAPLTTTANFGCGPVVPASPSSGVITHFDSACACVFSHALPAVATVADDPGAGAVLSVTSSVSLDLGCGVLAAAPGGSTLITRLDPAGNCVFGRSLDVPGLTAAIDASGRVVVSGLVGPVAVNLGGGALAPLGSQDFVLAELDPSGNHLWSKRFGSPGVTFASPKVSIASSGDVYLLTGWTGAVALGGATITAAAGEPVVGSYAPSGAHRWSRGFHIVGAHMADINRCGSLVVASGDNGAFDAGYGNVWASVGFNFYAAVAAFAP